MKGSGNVYLEILKDFFYSLQFWIKLQKTDIVVLNTFWSPFWGMFFKWKCKKVIYGVHRFPKRQFFLYRKVDEFICVSSVVANALKHRFPSLASRVSCINNPINTEVFNPEGRSSHNSEFIILYAGRIHPEKGIEILVAACNRLTI
jgi:glycosyltransferase involved in cell wall biosynthesis